MLQAIFSPRVLLAAAIVGITLFLATLALLWYTRPADTNPGFAPAVLNVTPGVTATPLPPTPPPTVTLPPTQAPVGGLVAGGYARVTGTAGDGLRLRVQPGLNGDILFVGSEGETFLVIEGPHSLDGYTWWRLEDPDDATRQGWAVGDFLIGIANP